MNVEYTGRGTTISPRLKRLAEEQLTRLDQIIGRTVSAHVILTEDKYRMTAEVNLLIAGETLTASCEDTDMEKALHDALRKIEQQSVKHKERRLTTERQAKPNSAEPLIEVSPVP